MGKVTMKNPTWWSDKHTSAWDRVKDAFARDWEQTKADFSKTKGQELDQDVNDTVKQAAGKQAIPPTGVPNAPKGGRGFDAYEDAEPALRYGFGASSQFSDYNAWDDRLENKLHGDWDALGTGSKWEQVKDAVRRGWERGRTSR
jgi:hypothetical protein